MSAYQARMVYHFHNLLLGHYVLHLPEGLGEGAVGPRGSAFSGLGLVLWQHSMRCLCVKPYMSCMDRDASTLAESERELT